MMKTFKEYLAEVKAHSVTIGEDQVKDTTIAVKDALTDVLSERDIKSTVTVNKHFDGIEIKDRDNIKLELYIRQDHCLIVGLYVIAQSVGLGSAIVQALVNNLPAGFTIELKDENKNDPKAQQLGKSFWEKMKDKHKTNVWIF